MKRIVYLLLVICLSAFAVQAYAQTDPLVQARVFAGSKEYDKAAEIYKKIYSQNPADAEVYNEYVNLLIEKKDFKEAEKIIREQQQIRQFSAIPFFDLGRLYMAAGKDKKAEEQFALTITMMSADDMQTQLLASRFIAIGKPQFAIQLYEKARALLHNNYMYSGPLARLYAQTGEIDKAIAVMLDAGPNISGGLDDIKASLLELLGTDRKKMLVAQKTIIKKINEQPENPYYAELLTWLYTQKDDWDGAMLQIQALDERHKEQGERLLEFARMATKEKNYEYAIKAYDAIIEKGAELPYYNVAKSEKLAVSFEQIQNKPDYTKEEVNTLANAYDAFLKEYPQFYSTQTARDYATLLAQYGDRVKEAIEVLQKVVDQPNSRRDFVGMAKLQMGDYQVVAGNVWDASLIYSQVDKAFKEDVLGEEARFRNAKLAYYRGDFEWAEGQLSVLKASTSELIANDALYLSVLITENITPDSNFVPIRRFAYADLLLFQNKDAEAEKLLDSISQNFPTHPLQDDILMLRARVAVKHRDYNKALTNLKTVYEKYAEDVLGDDALFKTAEIHEQLLNNKAEAKKFYEQLILTYPGSTYVQVARKHIADMAEQPVP
jgi:predicted Zn-dependent protease